MNDKPQTPATVKHVARLLEQNRLLAECLADERRLRKETRKWYQNRLNSRISSIVDLVWLTFQCR